MRALRTLGSMNRRACAGQGRRRAVGVQRGPVRVDILAVERCFATSVALTLDILETANTIVRALGRSDGLFRGRVLSPDGAPVVSSSGVPIAVSGNADEAEGDALVVCGPGMADVRRVLDDVRSAAGTAVLGHVRSARARGAVVAASCSSTFLLAEAGVLDGLSATTSWWLIPTFRSSYPRVQLRESEMLVDAGSVVTAGAALAHTQLIVHLVGRFGGPELAEACGKYLAVEDVVANQSKFMIVGHMAAGDIAVQDAERSIRRNPLRPSSLVDLARDAGLTPRTLSRRFAVATGLSPQRFVRRVRLELAAHLLRTTSETVAVIAGQVGYDDERAFRRAFQRELGASPSRYRARVPEMGGAISGSLPRRARSG